MNERDPAQLEQWMEPLLRAMSAPARRGLARRIGTDLRRSQQRRIASQQNPDGTPYAPRKDGEGGRGKRGRIKRRAMFAKIRQPKHLKVQATPDAAAVQFLGRVARIAQVHQGGLPDRVARGGPRVRYERRELLGFNAADRELIERTLLEHFAST